MGIMIPEWDYSHAKSKGKNIFFLRDTNHASEEVAAVLLDELDRLVNQHFFPVLFSEGFEGLSLQISLEYGSEEELKKLLLERQGRWLAQEVFAYRHREEINSGQFLLYGVDSDSLIEEQKKDGHRILELYEKQNRGESLTPMEIQECRWRMNVNGRRISEQRSAYSVEKIEELMKSVDTAGLVYGNGHFPEIAAGLEKAEIGYVSFFPGEAEVDREKIIDYVRRFK